MIGFFFKKAFFDGWDNLLGLIALNVGYIVTLFIVLFGLMAAETSVILMIAIVALGLLAFSLFSGGVAGTTFGYSDYKRETLQNFAKGFKRNWRHSLVYFAILAALVAIAFFVFPFYISMGNMVGLLVAVILFWIMLAFTLALPYYFPLTSFLPGDKPLKTLKKCFVILGDNMGFSMFYAIYRLVSLVLTVVTLGLIPGFAGFSLANMDALKLMMLKYDFLEEHGDEVVNPKKLPWEDILYDEREKVGPRSLKSMIFPWKY